MDFIAENFLIIVIIIGGLLSLFKNKSTPSEADRQQSRNQPVSRTGRTEDTKGLSQANTSVSSSSSSESPHGTVSAEEQQQKQLKELQKRMGGSSFAVVRERDDGSHEANIKNNLKRPDVVKPYHHEHFKKEIKGKLNQKGLIDSIVMAEVLGPPRAKKPYSSIISKER